MSAALRVVAPGLMTTVQDFGRIGYQRLGIPVGGALDPLSLRAANLLVGNPPDAGALEVIASGPTLAIEAECVRVAFVGADADLSVAGEAFDPRVSRSMLLRRGDILRVGPLRGSATLYMAVEGGFDIAPVMGSFSTYLRGGLGGWRGRALAAGDVLPLKRSSTPERAELAFDTADFAPRRRLRVLEGPQSDYFSEEERAAFFGREYSVGPGWNRMGMRLVGEPVRHSRGYNVTSDGIVRGSIQIPGDGLPIVLLAEHQTTGGYPKIGAVISADLPALGRLGVGSKVAFERVSLKEAEAAGRAHLALVERLPSRLSPMSAAGSRDLPARLGETNLVSGVIDACAWS
ncbi:MAG: biotin-dependent carboxyltransferase family protein [Roseiarcus sp.]|uniref:5-oxoprolinase subunit C family protein n=1 Tax=Roseiarcus sp. TaxID=1969460 RepID=UPI003BB0A043